MTKDKVSINSTSLLMRSRLSWIHTSVALTKSDCGRDCNDKEAFRNSIEGVLPLGLILEHAVTVCSLAPQLHEVKKSWDR